MAGASQWARAGVEKMLAEGNNIAVQDTNNILVTGYFTGNILLDAVELSSYKVDFFVASYNTNSTMRWIDVPLGIYDDYPQEHCHNRQRQCLHCRMV